MSDKKDLKVLDIYCPFCCGALVQGRTAGAIIHCRGWYGFEPCDFEYKDAPEYKYKPLTKSQKDNKQVKNFENEIGRSFDRLKNEVSFTRAKNSLTKMQARLTR